MAEAAGDRARYREGRGRLHTFVQRVNSTLGNFVRLHVTQIDGVCERDRESLAFREGPAPSREEIAAVAEHVEERTPRWLRRHGFLDERPAEDRSNGADHPTPSKRARRRRSSAASSSASRRTSR